MPIKKKVAHVVELEARIIKEIRHKRAYSRLKLATLLRLAPSTIGIYVDRLIARGYLREEPVGKKTQQRGRPALRLYLCGEAGCFVGAEFEAENIYAVCADFAGNILARHRSKLAPDSNAADVLSGLEKAIRHVLDKKFPRLLGVGIGVPGIIDATRGIARDYRFIKGWHDILVAQKLRERFKVPILLENNARATALGNLLFEPTNQSGDFVSLLIRSGVGAGIVIDGALYRGKSFLAGEVGRIQPPRLMTMPTPSETLEDTASIQGIVNFVRLELKRETTSLLHAHAKDLAIQHIIDAAQEGDDLARKSLQRAARALGWLAHVMTLIINPSFIILTGPLNALGEWFRLEVQAALNDYASTTRTDQPRIHLSQLNEEAGALGAASLAIDAWKPTRTANPKSK